MSNICTADETGDVVVGDEDDYVVGNKDVSVQISDVLGEVITSPTGFLHTIVWIMRSLMTRKMLQQYLRT